MNGAVAVTRRLLLELRGDRRTLALVLVVPVFITFLFGEVFPRPERVAHVLLGVFVFLLTYLLTAVGFLRERTHGTLERVLVAPVARSEIVVGYVLGFGVLATVQSFVLLGAGVVFLDASFEHGVGLFLLVELLGAFTALGTGIVLSLFAETEFQAIQFIPVVITPQVVLGGTFLPVGELAWYLEYPARAMPVTYLIDGMAYVVRGEGTATDLWTAVAVLAGFTVAAVLAAGVVVDRRAA